MQLYGNQLAIRVKKAPANKDNIYSIFNNEIMFKAMRDLSPSAFKLWIYMGKNQNDYVFALSQKDVSENTGLSSRTYYIAVHELMDKGYLVKSLVNPKIWGYDFIEEGKAT